LTPGSEAHIFLYHEMRNQGPPNPLDLLTRVSHALADPCRVRLLAACLGRERCVCQLVALIGRPNATVSKHLGVLRDAGLLVARREGRWIHYRTPDEPGAVVRGALGFVRSCIGADARLASDRRALERIDTIDPGALARMQREGCCPDLTVPPPPRADTARGAHQGIIA